MEKKQSFKIFVVIVIFATVMVSLYYVQGDPSHSKTRAELSEKENIPVITHVVLFTSLQDKATFDNLKSSISKKYGNPDLEEYEEGTEVIDGRYYGKCRWNNGEIMLRNTHRD